ncbi:nuclear pore complex protein Nup98-Nup96-like [Drosophila tropicalis]|uniref:nuclear pore complex protein Nup98-Nup96-like n=1 Tax=Drosophila tropicalis TaxID=46794 RepID=UPI0035AB85D6
MACGNGFRLGTDTLGQQNQSPNIFGASASIQTAFGQTNKVNMVGFSSQTSGAATTSVFGTISQASDGTGTGGTKYEILICTETPIEKDDPLSLDVKIHNITATKEYIGKSTDELRWEDYQAGRQGPEIASALGNGFVLSTPGEDIEMRDISEINVFRQPTAITAIENFGFPSANPLQNSFFGTAHELNNFILRSTTTGTFVTQTIGGFSSPSGGQTGFGTGTTGAVPTRNLLHSSLVQLPSYFLGGLQNTSESLFGNSSFGGLLGENGFGNFAALQPMSPITNSSISNNFIREVADASTQYKNPSDSKTKIQISTNSTAAEANFTSGSDPCAEKLDRIRLYNDLKEIEVADNEFKLTRSPKRLLFKPLDKSRPKVTFNLDPIVVNAVHTLKSDMHKKTCDHREEQHIKRTHPTGIVLQRIDYYTIPSLNDLLSYLSKDGSCVVPTFTVGREGYGNAYFNEEIDVAGLNLDKIVHFHRREISMYPDATEKPAIGQGLNRNCQVTLDGIWPRSKNSRLDIKDPRRINEMNFEGRLRRANAESDARFLEYRPETGSWVFQVKHFSQYSLNESDELNDTEVSAK